MTVGEMFDAKIAELTNIKTAVTAQATTTVTQLNQQIAKLNSLKTNVPTAILNSDSNDFLKLLAGDRFR